MKLRTALLATTIAVSSLLGGCSRNRQEAAILANQGDQEVKLNVDGAIQKYENASRMDPTNHRIFFKLAMAYRKKEDWDKAASTLSRAVQLAPKFANYWFERGYALEQQAKKKTIQWDEAKEPFTKCVEADPNYAECYEELGNIFLWTDDEQRALDNYSKAVEHDPSNVAYYNVLADLYIRLGYVKEAEQILKSAKDAPMPVAPAPKEKKDDGEGNEAKAKDKAAAEAANKKAARDKSLYGTHILLAQVYQDRGSQAEQVAELEAAKSIVPAEGPEAITILYQLGSTYAVMNPPRSAEAISMLKGFNGRACKSAKASQYKAECETSQALVNKLGGSLQ